ncbi:MAG: gamma-glutamyl-gamma-aminobutyrate hydrolase family protein [Candidatus Cloacimonetes bacterium]|nr:gamma-glutamyl-gamma-aminobutyrate hydrolase family protein [Candidatus Cloacimonadota bacterium]
MLLIYNTIVDAGVRSHFDEIAGSRLFPGTDLDIVHLGEKFPDCGKYSHLLLTGSELSASQGSEWDNSIFELIEKFYSNNKAIYGICHGHQMLARFLAGDKCCRRAKAPEYGYKTMQIAEDELFAGIDVPIFLESRYDEVFDLPHDFRIIASNETEAVQAFRYKELPVWGTQFHPEFIREDGDPMLENHLSTRPQERKFYRDDWVGKTFEPQSLRIFGNFF